MNEILFRAHGRKACAVFCGDLTSGSVGLPIKFEFDSAWDGLQKTAIFKGSGTTIDVVLTGDTAAVPAEVMEDSGLSLKVGVWGADPDDNVVIPTVWVEVGKIKPGAEPSGIDPHPPAPSWAAQVQQIATEALTNSEEAVETANATEARMTALEEEIADDLEQAGEYARQAQEAARSAGEDAQTAAAAAQTAGSAASTASAAAATATEKAADTARDAAAAQEAASEAETAKDAAETAAASIAASAAQIEQNRQDIADLDTEVSQQKSAFEAHEQYAEATYAKQDGSYEDLTAGNAYELLSDRGDTNQQPYLFRQTGGDSSAYNREQLKKIVGGTVAWNQTMRDINDASQANNWGANNGTVAYSDGKIVFTPKADTSNKNFGQAASASAVSVQGHKYFYSATVNRAKAGANFAASPRIGQVISFGDIPAGVDYYIKGVFEASAASALRFFLYPWGTASFAADGTETVTVKSPMIIDLTQMFGTAIADYIYSLEQATAGAGVAFFRSLFPADYYDYNPGELKSVEGVSAHIMRDADNNIVGNYPLDSSLTLRGIPKMDSDNRLYYDGDTYEPDGTVNRRYAVVDLGTLNWSKTDNKFFLRLNPTANPPSASTVIGNVLCSQYAAISQSAASDKCVYLSYPSGLLYIVDSAYSDAASFKAAMSGVMLVYELATPTTETAEPYRELEICDRDGTEEFVSTSIVPVGHETFYPVNVFDYIDRLTEPDADMIADSVIAANKYFSVGNRLFLSTASIAAGAQIIPGTNCQETSLAAALNALNA